CQHRNNYPLTF
nr:immunoglobulin light chain junction region [Macaca mulatta]